MTGTLIIPKHSVFGWVFSLFASETIKPDKISNIKPGYHVFELGKIPTITHYHHKVALTTPIEVGKIILVNQFIG